MKKTTLLLIAIIIVAAGAYAVVSGVFTNTADTSSEQQGASAGSTDSNTDEPEPGDDVTGINSIGESVEGRAIDAYHFGNGDTELLFVGGIHGGYEWNTSLVAYELIDYLQADPARVPENVRVTVIPTLNPDGLHKTLGTEGRFSADAVTVSLSASVPGRFNAHNVDLNRNFDCDWQSTGVWQDTTVDAGTAAFSEPEAAALRDYVITHQPAAAIVWYSAAGGVFASSCHNGVSAETAQLTTLYADASGYPAYEAFDFYAITGDMVNWLAKRGIPAISVLLTNHRDVEWSKNKAGIDAILDYYAQTE